MALVSTRKSTLLGPSFVLAPERYDPRREFAPVVDSVPLGEIVQNVRKIMQPSESLGPCLILDTSDAREGFIICRKKPCGDIGSAKKSLQPGDVIVSRLRPYLRQVAFVDAMIPNVDRAILVCSTEFFVLRPKDDQSIAFLVPFLLSEQIQKILSASQEGGHHPRFDDTTLLGLPVPKSLLESRDNASTRIEAAATHYRRAEKSIDHLVAVAQMAVMETGSSDVE